MLHLFKVNMSSDSRSAVHCEHIVNTLYILIRMRLSKMKRMLGYTCLNIPLLPNGFPSIRCSTYFSLTESHVTSETSSLN